MLNLAFDSRSVYVMSFISISFDSVLDRVLTVETAGETSRPILGVMYATLAIRVINA